MEVQMYCQCGCGQITNIHNWSDKRTGAVKGQHARYIQGHHTRNQDSGDLTGVKWDAEDDELIQRYSWRVCKPDGKKAYAMAAIKDEHGKHRTTYMHRLILNAPKGVEVDHINGDGLDNRRENLRLASRIENCRNRPPLEGCSSKFKGVSWHNSAEKWVVYIHLHRKPIFLGLFDDEVEAAKAYNRAAERLYREFAYLNDVSQ